MWPILLDFIGTSNAGALDIGSIEQKPIPWWVAGSR
jgi:hypothetical protein